MYDGPVLGTVKLVRCQESYRRHVMANGFWLHAAQCVLADALGRYVLVITTDSPCIDPGVGGIWEQYLLEKLTNDRLLAARDRRRFEEHYRRCLACSCAVENVRQERAASEAFGIPLGSAKLRKHIRSVRTEMSQHMFERLREAGGGGATTSAARTRGTGRTGARPRSRRSGRLGVAAKS